MILVEKSKSGLLRRDKTTIVIEPPKAFDKAWERDGIEEQAAAGKGKRAFWMTQVFSAMDLALWTERSGLAPSEVLAMRVIERELIVGSRLGEIPDQVPSVPFQLDLAAQQKSLRLRVSATMSS